MPKSLGFTVAFMNEILCLRIWTLRSIQGNRWFDSRRIDTLNPPHQSSLYRKARYEASVRTKWAFPCFVLYYLLASLESTTYHMNDGTEYSWNNYSQIIYRIIINWLKSPNCKQWSFGNEGFSNICARGRNRRLHKTAQEMPAQILHKTIISS